MIKNSDQKIVLDSDVIIHFVKANKLLFLPKIYPHRLIILNNVHNELCSYRSLKQFYEGVVERTNITFEKFPENNTELVLEYARLKKDGCGEGESASMAYAKHNNYILASSNISDVKDFCKSNNITLITTMDILYEALINNILSEEGCDDFIRVVVSKDSKLPYKTMQEYINRK